MRVIASNSNRSSLPLQICAIGGGGPARDDIRRLGISAEILNSPTKIPSATAIFRLLQHIRSVRPLIIHLHGAEANFHGAIAARIARVPVVLAEEIGVPRHSRKAQIMFREIYKRCDRVVAISQAVADSIVALGEAKANQIEVIYNPFSREPFRPFPPRGGQLRLGFVGRLEAVKNPVCAIDALARLRGSGLDATLVIVGEGSQRSLLELRIAELGLGEYVELAGFHARPFELLKNCHLYVQPSVSEGFGLAICEAMSAGMPVIASAVGGAPEIIEHGETGWLLDAPTAEGLAHLVTAVAQKSDAELASIGKRAASSVARFSPEVYMRRCDELYARLLECKRESLH